MLREDKHGKSLQDKLERGRDWRQKGLFIGYGDSLSIRARDSCYIGKSIELRGRAFGLDCEFCQQLVCVLGQVIWNFVPFISHLQSEKVRMMIAKAPLSSIYCESVKDRYANIVTNFNWSHSSPYAFQKNLDGYQMCVWFHCVKINSMTSLLRMSEKASQK